MASAELGCLPCSPWTLCEPMQPPISSREDPAEQWRLPAHTGKTPGKGAIGAKGSNPAGHNSRGCLLDSTGRHAFDSAPGSAHNPHAAGIAPPSSRPTGPRFAVSVTPALGKGRQLARWGGCCCINEDAAPKQRPDAGTLLIRREERSPQLTPRGAPCSSSVAVTRRTALPPGLYYLL